MQGSYSSLSGDRPHFSVSDTRTSGQEAALMFAAAADVVYRRPLSEGAQCFLRLVLRAFQLVCAAQAIAPPSTCKAEQSHTRSFGRTRLSGFRADSGRGFLFAFASSLLSVSPSLFSSFLLAILSSYFCFFSFLPVTSCLPLPFASPFSPSPLSQPFRLALVPSSHR